MTKDKQAEDRQALERLLEVCGADRTRWPARERLRFASVVGEDAEAKRMVAEAAALDSLLDLAPRASDDREHALKERIVATALRSAETKLAVVGGSAKADPARAPARPRSYAFGRASVGQELPAAAVLAASLVIGVMLGSAGTFDSTMQNVAEVTGLASAGDSSQLALGEEIVAVADEDLL